MGSRRVGDEGVSENRGRIPRFGTRVIVSRSRARAASPSPTSNISDAHDDHVHDQAFGPGAGYVAQLQAYDQAFAAFFTSLAAAGIDKSNTLFVFTVDEGDHTPIDGAQAQSWIAQAQSLLASASTLAASVGSSSPSDAGSTLDASAE